MEEQIRYRLTKGMILRSKTAFQELFNEGKSLRSGSLVLKYRIAETSAPSKAIVAFLVSKKHGRAVDRNRVRRLMREAWRLEYPSTAEQLPENVQVHIGLIWSGKPAKLRAPRFQEVQKDVRNGMQRLLKRLQRLESN